MSCAVLTIGHTRLWIVCFLIVILFLVNLVPETTFGQESGTVEDALTGLSSQDDYVRMHAALALGKLKSSRAVEPLINALHSDTKNTVRGPAAWEKIEVRSSFLTDFGVT